MKLNKIIKWCMVVLLLISAAITVWGYCVGFHTPGSGQAVDVLFYWAYAMIALALISWVVVGGIVSAKANPKGLLKTALVIVALAVVCFVVYLISPAHDAVGREGMDSLSTLKLTDTTLNLAYIAGAATIIAMIVGEIRMAINNRK